MLHTQTAEILRWYLHRRLAQAVWCEIRSLHTTKLIYIYNYIWHNRKQKVPCESIEQTASLPHISYHNLGSCFWKHLSDCRWIWLPNSELRIEFMSTCSPLLFVCRLADCTLLILSYCLTNEHTPLHLFPSQLSNAMPQCYTYTATQEMSESVQSRLIDS